MDSIGQLAPAAKVGDVGRVAASLAVGSPFCDYLNISVSKDFADVVDSALSGWLDGYGFVRSDLGLYQAMRLASVRGRGSLECVGTLKRRCGANWVGWSASGGAVAHLRRQGVFDQYLGIFGGVPHRVTMLHASCDYVADGPVVVKSVLDQALAGRIRLTRKWVEPKNVKSILSVDAFGILTGTIYLGQRRNADVWAKVYDKRHERISRGFADPGPLTRVEVACMSDVGASLRDAAIPDGLYFQFAGPSLVEVPASAPAWFSSCEGFVCSRTERSVFQRVDGLLEGCGGLRQAAVLARQSYGEGWKDLLLRQVRLQLERIDRGAALSEGSGHVQ